MINRHFGMLGAISGLALYSSEYLPRFRTVQFRKPRSKRKRIRIKWSKRPENWRQEKINYACLIGGNTLIMRPDQIQLLRQASLVMESLS
jgi:hypothetical protein